MRFSKNTGTAFPTIFTRKRHCLQNRRVGCPTRRLDTWSDGSPCYYDRENLEAGDLEAAVVVLGGVVGAGDHGSLRPGLLASGLDVDASAGDVPELGEGASKLPSNK
jgi:hypothetical protein